MRAGYVDSRPVIFHFNHKLNLMNIALITARGGSKGLPRKNILLLGGIPLIGWTIRAAMHSGSIDKVFVSTEDNEITEISMGFGAEIIRRPMCLAEDTTSSDAVIAHAINYFMKQNIKVENICLLQPTSPLRNSDHIDQAFDLFDSVEAKCVLSVFEPRFDSAKSYKVNVDGSITGLLFEDAPYTRRQDLPSTCQPNGAIYIFGVTEFILYERMPRKQVYPFYMSENDSADIDTIDDLRNVEAIINSEKNMTSPVFEISGRKVGAEYAPLVIVEIGINHEGSLDTAYELVDAAWKAGAEVIKHQTHVVEDEMSQSARNVIPGNADVSIYEIMERCALNEEDEIKLKKYVEAKGMIFISTPFSRAAADRLYRMNIAAFKIGSGECNNYPLIEHIASFGIPMIVSTGMNDIESVKKMVAILDAYNVPYALLHTTNLYPTPSHLVRLGALGELQKAFPRINVGLSDHTTSNLACFGAVAMGATILERHFTDRMDRPGPDIVNSMDPVALKELIIGSEEIAKMRGGKKEAAKEEQVTIDFAFSTVVSIKNIKKGTPFTKDNIWVKRPGTGEIPAAEFGALIGKVAVNDIDNDRHLAWEDVGE
ncbi:MAG: N-acetylneuraminate synthase family protein [Agarilytica sp.]